MDVLLVNSGVYGCVVLLLSAALFLLMQIKQDNSLIDIAYGPLFFFSALFTLILINTYTPLALCITVCMGIWAARLSSRIFKKNWGTGEDQRYRAWRNAWMARGEVYFIVRSFLQINLLQGIIITLVALPFIVATTTTETLSLPFVIMGLIVFVIGLAIEATADAQLDAFLKKKKTDPDTSHILTTGLFHYSRRPNYFGETLVWWGLAIMVLPLPYGWIAIASPLLITYIVTAITGPMLEAIFLKKYGDEYKAYMVKTSYFVPWPPQW